MEVVPVVVDVEHPVLERDLPRVAGVGHDVRVHRRLVTLVDVPRPVQVVAARVERVAREVEVILVEPGPEVAGARPDLHEVGARPRPAQRDRRLVEEQIDVDRDVRLPGAAALGLIDEPDDGGVARRERRLVRRRRGGGRRRGHPRGGEDGGEHGDSGPRRHRPAPPSLGVLTSPQSARLIWVMAGSAAGIRRCRPRRSDLTAEEQRGGVQVDGVQEDQRGCERSVHDAEARHVVVDPARGERDDEQEDRGCDRAGERVAEAKPATGDEPVQQHDDPHRQGHRHRAGDDCPELRLAGGRSPSPPAAGCAAPACRAASGPPCPARAPPSRPPAPGRPASRAPSGANARHEMPPQDPLGWTPSCLLPPTQTAPR